VPVYLIMITNNDNDFIKESDGKIGGIFSKKVFNYRLHCKLYIKDRPSRILFQYIVMQDMQIEFTDFS
jgi:hypothetical protein